MGNFFIHIVIVLLMYSLWLVTVRRDNLIILLVSVEVLVMSANLFFGYLGIYLDDVFALVVVLILLAVAAADSAVSLALMVSFYRLRSSIEIKLLSSIKG
jgi:NADH-quinone oxidoreductase subunit K